MGAHLQSLRDRRWLAEIHDLLRDLVLVRHDAVATELNAGPKLPVLEGNPDGSEAGPVELEPFGVPWGERRFDVHEAEALELLDPAVARRDWDCEPATDVQRGDGMVEGPEKDPRRILVHDGLAHLQCLHGLFPLEREDPRDEARNLVRLKRPVQVADRS